MKAKFILALGFCTAMTTAHAAGELDEVLKPCVGCHGSDGVGTSSKIPFINWQLPSYLVNSMLALQGGTRVTAVPKHVPKTMTREQIGAIADHFGNNRAPRQRQPAEATRVAKGQALYFDRCASCHLDNGRSTDDKGGGTPILAGQSADYLLAQERLYVSGKRKFANGADRAHVGLTDADLEAVSHFFASQDMVRPGSEPASGKKRRT